MLTAVWDTVKAHRGGDRSSSRFEFRMSADSTLQSFPLQIKVFVTLKSEWQNAS